MTERLGGQDEVLGVDIGAGYVGRPVGTTRIRLPVAEVASEDSSDFSAQTTLTHDIRLRAAQPRTVPRIGEVLDGLLDRIDETIETFGEKKGN